MSGKRNAYAGTNNRSQEQNDNALPAPLELDDDDAAEGRPSERAGAEKMVSDLTRSNEEPPMKKVKGRGQNKSRTFARIDDEGIKLCSFTARGEECRRLRDGHECNNEHDLRLYLTKNKGEHNILEATPDEVETKQNLCPVGLELAYSYAISAEFPFARPSQT